MDSASQSEIPPGEPPNLFAKVFGFFIAVLTLTLPLFVIDHFSSAKGLSVEPPPYRFSETQR
jgi:hypothetical protein